MKFNLRKLNPASRANAVRLPILIGLAVETVALVQAVRFYVAYETASPRQKAMWGRRR